MKNLLNLFLKHTLVLALLMLVSQPLYAQQESIFPHVFRLEDGENNDSWQFLYSIGGVDVVVNTTVAHKLVAAGKFHLEIRIKEDSDNPGDFLAEAFIDGVLVATTTALTSAAALKPFIGLQRAGGAGASDLFVFWTKVSGLYTS